MDTYFKLPAGQKKAMEEYLQELPAKWANPLLNALASLEVLNEEPNTKDNAKKEKGNK